MIEYLRIGEIVNTVGLKGEVKIYPLTSHIERFNKIKWAYMENDGHYSKIDFERVRLQKNVVIAKIKGIDDIDQALRLKDKYICVDRENAVKLKKDEYFICDLIGCVAVTADGTEIGKVTDVFSTGSNDVYVIKNSEGEETLLPAIKKIVKEVDINNKKIIVEPMETLES